MPTDSIHRIRGGIVPTRSPIKDAKLPTIPLRSRIGRLIANGPSYLNQLCGTLIEDATTVLGVLRRMKDDGLVSQTGTTNRLSLTGPPPKPWVLAEGIKFLSTSSPLHISPLEQILTLDGFASIEGGSIIPWAALFLRNRGT